MANDIVKAIHNLNRLNWKTILFNFKYLPFNQAIKFPVVLYHNVLLKELNGNISFNCPVCFGLVQIGFGNIHIFDKERSRTIWEVKGDVIFNGPAFIGHGSKISVDKTGLLIIGMGFTITAESTIFVREKVEFGNGCLISWDVLIMDNDAHRIWDENGRIINGNKPIYVGNHVWIGCRTTLLKGSYIPDHSVISSNSLVNTYLETTHAIYAGVPAKLKKQNITWGF
jgi:hypothetical protein